MPGHRCIVKNHKERIRELQEHHKNRLQEILSALGSRRKTVFRIAPQVTWNIDYSSWKLFPISQKWFAFGEILAHLKYLEGEGMVREEMDGNKVLFSVM